MIPVDLITGFLGSGKTTFIIKYASYLADKGLRVGIIENDLGAVNVDRMLLQDAVVDRCDVDMVAAACDKDCYMRRLRTKFIEMAMLGYDRVLMEPSGAFDVEELFDVIHDDTLERWYEMGSVIAIVDAGLTTDLSEEARYLLTSQIACAGKIVLSRVQETDEERQRRTIGYLNEVMEQFQCSRRFDKDVLACDWNDLTGEQYDQIAHAGYGVRSYRKLWIADGEGFQSCYFLSPGMDRQQTETFVSEVFNDKACGKIFRIKGFFRDKEAWQEINAVANGRTVRPIREGQDVLIVIGEDLDKDHIQGHLDAMN